MIRITVYAEDDIENVSGKDVNKALKSIGVKKIKRTRIAKLTPSQFERGMQ